MEPIRVASFHGSIVLILRKCQYDDDDVLFAYVAKREGLPYHRVLSPTSPSCSRRDDRWKQYEQVKEPFRPLHCDR
jgi:hypothetical protein